MSGNATYQELAFVRPDFRQKITCDASKLSCTIPVSSLMAKLTEKLLLFVQIILVGVGILSLVFGVFALIGSWLSQGS
jgi:hypothetical protein